MWLAFNVLAEFLDCLLSTLRRISPTGRGPGSIRRYAVAGNSVILAGLAVEPARVGRIIQ
jgi:hypothetical protein